MLGILAERQRVEEIAEQTPLSKVRNVLSAGTLAHLFDERKACKTQAELDELSREFGMDPEIVERLAKHLNSPSISKIALPTKDANDTPKQLVSDCGAIQRSVRMFAPLPALHFRFAGAMGRPAPPSSGTTALVCIDRHLASLVARVQRIAPCISSPPHRNFRLSPVWSGCVPQCEDSLCEYFVKHLRCTLTSQDSVSGGSLQGS